LSWGDDNTIVIGGAGGLWSIPAAGGTARQLTEAIGIFPEVLPGSKAVVINTYVTDSNTMDANKIEVLELATGKKKTLVEGGYFARYVPTSGETGHLLYMHEGNLFGVGFDPRRLELLGTPAPLLSDVAASTDRVSGGGQFAVSSTGTLVYLSGTIEGSSYPILSMDTEGKTTPLVARPGIYGALRLSPDGRQLAYVASGNGGFDVWVSDVTGGTPTQLTFLRAVSWELVWAPDSKHLVYGDGKTLWWIRSDGGGQAQLLVDNVPTPRPSSFAPLAGKDARLLFSRAQNGLPDLWTLPIDLSDPERPRAGKAEPFLTEPRFVEVDGAFSPDGKFLAYASNDKGSQQVFVRPFPGPGGRWQVSTAGGQFPTWLPSTRELLFLGGDDHIMAASYMIGGSGGQEDAFSIVGTPRVWSPQQVRRDGVRQNFDVSRDGKRVVMFPRPAAEKAGGNLHATFLLNFFDEVRRRAPLNGKN
jgi:serine/threonine-protein kinase